MLGRFSVAFGPSGRREADELEVFGLLGVGEGERACVEAFDEVNFPLVLPGFGGLDGTTLPAEGHEPAFVSSVLESGVVVLQNDLCEDAVPSPAVSLSHEFPPAVHTQVSARLRSFDPNSTPEGVRLHIKSGESVPVLRGGADSAARDLHVSPAGPAVQLIHPNLPPAQLVRQRALFPHILLKIRRRVILLPLRVTPHHEEMKRDVQAALIYSIHCENAKSKVLSRDLQNDNPARCDLLIK